MLFRNGSKSEDFTINAIRNRTASPKPCGIEVFKGFKNGAFTTDFIRALLSNPFLNAYYSWLAAGKCPEEHLTATLATLSIQEGGHEGEWRIWQRLDKGVENQNYPMINDNSWLVIKTATTNSEKKMLYPILFSVDFFFIVIFYFENGQLYKEMKRNIA